MTQKILLSSTSYIRSQIKYSVLMKQNIAHNNLLIILEATNPEGGKNCKLNETLFFKVYRVLLNTKKKPPKIPRVKTCFLRPFQIAQWVEKGFDEDISPI